MTEHDVLSATLASHNNGNNSDKAESQSPVTRRTLTVDLRQLGLRAGMTVLVHTSVSRLGWVLGGPQTIIEALQDVLGNEGTLMMPAHSMQLTDPQHWRNPPVPEAWWPIIRQEAPVFDPHLTPTRSMGAVAELFRNLPGVVRSSHPHGSFTARGPRAEVLVAGHELTDMFGEASPLARLYDADGHVLLLGVDHGNNTSLHLAENRADFPGKQWIEQGARLQQGDTTQWTTFADFDASAEDFAELGRNFAADTGEECMGPAGWGEARLMPQREVVDYGREWLTRHRG